MNPSFFEKHPTVMVPSVWKSTTARPKPLVGEVPSFDHRNGKPRQTPAFEALRRVSATGT